MPLLNFQIKEKSDDASTLSQIRQLLQPFEYTKIDKIIDVIFTTAANVESQQEIEQQTPAPSDDDQNVPESSKQVRTDPELLNAKRQQAVEAFSTLKGKELVKRSKTLYWSPDKDLRVCCAASKRYKGGLSTLLVCFPPFVGRVFV